MPNRRGLPVYLFNSDIWQAEGWTGKKFKRCALYTSGPFRRARQMMEGKRSGTIYSTATVGAQPDR